MMNKVEVTPESIREIKASIPPDPSSDHPAAATANEASEQGGKKLKFKLPFKSNS